MYPNELESKDTNDTPKYICYIKLWKGKHIKINSRTIWPTDDFDLPIVVFIFINSYIAATSAYGVYIRYGLCPVQWFLATQSRLRCPSVDVIATKSLSSPLTIMKHIASSLDSSLAFSNVKLYWYLCDRVLYYKRWTYLVLALLFEQNKLGL